MSEPRLYGKEIPEGAAAILREILTSANVGSAQITSVARTPAEQARVMWENLAAPLPGTLKVLYKDSVDRYMHLYKPPGQAVIQVYAAHRTLAAAPCQALMEAKILELGPRAVSAHCAGPDSSVWVIDVNPGSIPGPFREAVSRAARVHPRVANFLQPPADPAFHFEILKEAQTLADPLP